MKIAILAQNSLDLYPALHEVAQSMRRKGAEVAILATTNKFADDDAKLSWFLVDRRERLAGRLPWFRSNGDAILTFLYKTRPDFVLAECEYLVTALAYKMLTGGRTKLGAYFPDYHGERRYTRYLAPFAGFLDAYVDVCDMRLAWRRRDWPRLRAPTFVIRHAAPLRADAVHEPHGGPARIVFTGSRYVLGLDRTRLARFLSRLCARGLAVDWYLPGPDDVRATARALLSHPLFAVHAPVDKARLGPILAAHDVGLHWAPMAERDHDPDYFVSAASNKIGEYIAAGLVVAHAGNPGLAYLPGDVTAVFDPTDPVAGADQLADALVDRAEVERRRAASLRFHQETMNFEAQAEPVIRHLLANGPQRRG